MSEHSVDPIELERIRTAVEEHGVHTVELAVTDTYGHLRGKRIPARRFCDEVASSGAHVADGIYIFDLLCDIVDSPFINMGKGFLDTHLTADLSTFRLLGHRPGYAIVQADAHDETGRLHPLSPRQALVEQIDRLGALGYEAVVSTEMEGYLLTDDWDPVQPHIQYSSLTDRHDLEVVLAEMRQALLDCGVPVESSNPEYGPGQIEVNVKYGDPMTVADDTVMLKAVIREIAERHGLRASFMPKLWDEPSGSGMHIHSSLKAADGDGNAFADSVSEPNAIMQRWIAGLLFHAPALTLLGIPFPNGYRRLVPYSFAPTHIHWGLDNRSVLARCIIGQGGANRVEYRAADASSNSYLMLAGLLAAGTDGIENEIPLMPMAEGDLYDDARGHDALPASFDAAIAAFRDSPIAAMIGPKLSENFVVLSENELAVAKAGGMLDSDSVTDWERERYRQFT